MPKSRLRLTSWSSRERRLRLSRRRHQLRQLYPYPFLHELLCKTAPSSARGGGDRNKIGSNLDRIPNLQGRAPTRTSSTYSNRERSSHSSPLRSLSPDGSVAGLRVLVVMGVYANRRVDGERGQGRGMSVITAATVGRGGRERAREWEKFRPECKPGSWWGDWRYCWCGRGWRMGESSSSGKNHTRGQGIPWGWLQ